MDVEEKLEPSRTSYYVSDALYGELVAAYTDWQRDELSVADPGVRDRFRMLLRGRMVF